MQFVNPYNFISLRQGKKQDLKNYHGKLTGRLACRFVLKTPLIIPDHTEKIEQAYNGKTYAVYPFMTLNGKPLIPGSSIRGAVRSLFETLTDSCVRTNDDYYFSSRTGSIKSAGLLQKTMERWTLYQAMRYADPKGLVTERAQTGDKVSFTGEFVGNSHYVKAATGAQRGYVLKMDQFSGKRSGKPFRSAYSVMEQDGNTVLNSFNNESIQPFLNNIEMSCKGSAAGKAREYRARFLALEPGELMPVWYEKDEHGMFCLALSQLSRNVYTKKPKDFLEEKNLQPCVNRSALCDACALFGFVGGGKNEGAMGSRLRFSDAQPIGEIRLSKPRLLPILASPRMSSPEFYLRLPGEKFYTADTPKVQLAGRKFYWHFNKERQQVDENPKMAAMMQCAETDGAFTFDVYFDGITWAQLNQLYTALTLGDNQAESSLWHKLGHGKPLGFGSVKILVERVLTREFTIGADGVFRYTEDVTHPECVPLPEELKIMLDRTTVMGKTVDYPRMTENGPIYEWFSRNRKFTARKEDRVYYQRLPPVTKEQTLSSDPGSGTLRTKRLQTNQYRRPQAGGIRRRVCVQCGKSHSTSFSGPDHKVLCRDCLAGRK